MDFSKTTVFILPVSNTLPTTGSTADLTANQFGIFKPDYTPATALNVSAQPYVMFAQGRPMTLPGVGTKKSDKIFLKNVVDWYAASAVNTADAMVWDITDFSAVCGEDVTISIRARSFYLDTAYYNGLTKSFTITTPCCDCGDDPCTTVDVADLIDQFVELINADNDINSISTYITASNVGDTTLRLTGNALASEPRTADPTNFPFQYDRLYFWAWAYKGPETSQDYNVWDSCDPFATTTETTNSTYLRGSYLEALKLERDYNSYNTAPIARVLWSNINFDGSYLSQVVTDTFYDFYYLKFKDEVNNSNNPVVPQDLACIILNPTGQNTGTIAVLTNFLGTPRDVS
jgi:hypothetical protein